MSMSEEKSQSYNDLFAEPAEAPEPEAEAEVTEPEAELPDPEPEQKEPEAEEKEEPKYLAKIDIDGREFELDEPKIQHLAEKFIEVSAENKELTKHRAIVQEAIGHIESIRRGENIDEAMQALGVDFDKLITDRVKDFIRRSTLSQKERELEDVRKENEKLRKDREERERVEATAREAEEGRRSANEIFENVKLAIDKIPENYREEIEAELIIQIEKKIRASGVKPSGRAIANAANIIYERKKKVLEPETKQVKIPPKPVKNTPAPESTKSKTSRYNAEDYTKLFS